MSGTLIGRIFDDLDRSAIMVSTYDRSVTYANGAATNLVGLKPRDVIGQTLAELIPEQYGLTADNWSLLRCLDDSEHSIVVGRSLDGEQYWIASAVPCADPVRPEIFATEHDGDLPEDAAKAQHEVLVLRAAVAMEHARVQRLLTAAMAASSEANRRMEFIGDLLADVGRGPINPNDGPVEPL